MESETIHTYNSDGRTPPCRHTKYSDKSSMFLRLGSPLTRSSLNPLQINYQPPTIFGSVRPRRACPTAAMRWMLRRTSTGRRHSRWIVGFRVRCSVVGCCCPCAGCFGFGTPSSSDSYSLISSISVSAAATIMIHLIYLCLLCFAHSINSLAAVWIVNKNLAKAVYFNQMTLPAPGYQLQCHWEGSYRLRNVSAVFGCNFIGILTNQMMPICLYFDLYLPPCC